MMYQSAPLVGSPTDLETPRQLAPVSLADLNEIITVGCSFASLCKLEKRKDLDRVSVSLPLWHRITTSVSVRDLHWLGSLTAPSQPLSVGVSVHNMATQGE